VASSRLYFLLESDAQITLVSPKLDPSISARLPTHSSQINWIQRKYTGRSDPIHVEDFHIVMTAIDDNPLSREVWEMCREKRVLVNVADVPPLCDFYFGAQLRQGPLQIMLSTGGMGPRIGALIRDRVKGSLPDNLEDAIEGVGELRKDLRKRAPGVGGELGQRRMDWMKGVSEQWGLDELALFKSEQVRQRALEEGWEKGKVVTPRDLWLGWGRCPLRAWPIWEEKRAWAVSGLLLGIAAGSVLATSASWLRRR
jgi:precorrin-2 dehydrogenase/sirohydrochlorin ferrochelatase